MNDTENAATALADPTSNLDNAASIYNEASNESVESTSKTDVSQNDSQNYQAPLPTANPSPSASFKKEDVKEIIAGVLNEFQSKNGSTHEPAPLTQEEFDKLFKVYRPDATVIQRILGGGEEAVKALHEIVQGTHGQSLAMSEYLLNQKLRDTFGQVEPFIQWAQEQQLAAYKSEFFEKYPDLKNHENLLLQIKDSLEKQGYRGNKEQVFEKLSTKAREILDSVKKKMGESGNNNTNPTPNNQSRMTPLMGGGRSAAATGENNHLSDTQKVAKSLFG
ncbi:MAG: hypothetical protein K1X66_02375 [Verrucomicrobiae bacterium]|nr:hypothetical protein [Verrucomicrobiae bacterium]